MCHLTGARGTGSHGTLRRPVRYPRAFRPPGEGRASGEPDSGRARGDGDRVSAERPGVPDLGRARGDGTVRRAQWMRRVEGEPHRLNARDEGPIGTTPTMTDRPDRPLDIIVFPTFPLAPFRTPGRGRDARCRSSGSGIRATSPHAGVMTVAEWPSADPDMRNRDPGTNPVDSDAESANIRTVPRIVRGRTRDPRNVSVRPGKVDL